MEIPGTEAQCGTMEIEVLDSESHAMYLGRALRMTEMQDEELRSRIAKAWAKFGIYKGELMSLWIATFLLDTA